MIRPPFGERAKAATADIYATEILGLLHPRLAQAFEEFRHRARGQGNVLFDPRDRIFRMQFLQLRQLRAGLLELAGLRQARGVNSMSIGQSDTLLYGLPPK